MKPVTLQYKKASASNLEDIYQVCEFKKPDWCWYEPRPESLLNSNIKSPIITLANDIPHLDDIEISEMMLFKQTSGLTVVPESDGYSYFHWFESDQEVNDGYDVIQCEKKEIAYKVYLKNETDLKKQYGILKQSVLPDTLKIMEYNHRNLCLVWTLVE
jgi:hypothetical protein